MPFFRPFKADRGDREGKADVEKADGCTERADAGGGGGSAVGGASASASVGGIMLEREKERPEKKKDRKPKDLESAPVATTAGENRSAAPARAQPGLSVNDFISKTKNQQRQGLKPSGPELIAYARYLGIDPVADHDLLWIAVEALEAPLPSDWTEHFDSNDRVFYYNATMRVSSWTHPLEHIYRETYKTMVNFRNANMAPVERAEKLHTLQQEVNQMEVDVQKEIAQWTEHTDEQGNRFYFNREERMSTWTDPRPAKCQILHLRMKMFRLLQSTTKASDLPDFDDPAFKRPKVGANRPPEGGLWSGSAGSWIEGDSEKATDVATGRKSPSSHGSRNGSDSESGDERKGKKKKKKKSKKNKKWDQEQPASPPPCRPSGSQNLKSSQSEPSVGGQPLLKNIDEARGGAGGPAGLTASPRGPQALAHYSIDSNEGLSTVGRARVKAGIRLEPISAPPGAAGGGAGTASGAAAGGASPGGPSTATGGAAAAWVP